MLFPLVHDDWSCILLTSCPQPLVGGPAGSLPQFCTLHRLVQHNDVTTTFLQGNVGVCKDIW
ncbi:hypothetical protein AB205_0047870 [Aquarana catesbeiana]|uniref:Uncharacterized protein n=1 Tax=Aquarana catesbeiana TaxID=8400 RepID=A0A2G9RP07_AQUCT|nr:hypothetical protein AB205_0047870 [Aquarana catesbeiana]